MIRLGQSILFTISIILLLFIFRIDINMEKPSIYELYFLTMGSSAHILIYPIRDTEGDYIIKRMYERIKYIERIANRFDKNSEISKINSMNIGETMKISEDMINLLIVSKELTEKTGGAFDPTYLTKLESESTPISNKKGRDGWNLLYINEDTMTITKLGDILIDLGAIAKGFSADRALESVDGLIKGGMVEIGGDISIYGEKPDGLPWEIMLPEEFGDYRIIIKGGGGVATSSSKHGNLKEGEYHIFDPRTGKQVCGIIQSNVISDSAAVSDAFATALIVLGKEGIDLIDRTVNLEGIVVVNNNLFKSNKIDDYSKGSIWGTLIRTSVLPQSDIEHHSMDSE